MPQRLILVVLTLLVTAVVIHGQSSSFTYQGRLQDGGTPASGTYDLQFRLFDALVSGNQVGTTLTRDNVAVSSGVFTVSLDFGAAAFPGGNRFLEIAVRQGASTGSYTTLSPLQSISSTPYSLRSATAGIADTAGSATTANNAMQLGGVAASQYVVTSDSRLSDPRSPLSGSNNYIQNTTVQQTNSNFNISGSGSIGGFFGVGTASPNTHLHMRANASQGFAFQMENTTTAKRLYVGNYGTSGGGNHWPGLNSANTSFLYAENSLVFTTPGGIFFSGSTTAEHMRIYPNGSIGINMNPGSSRFAVNHMTPNAFAAYIKTTGIAPANSYGLLVEAGTDATDSALQVNSQSGVPFLRIRGDGNIGIGTTNPTSPVHIRGPGRPTPFPTGVPLLLVTGPELGGPDKTFLEVTSTGMLDFDNTIIVNSPISACFGEAFGREQVLGRCSSSLRYKTNINEFRSGLDVIKRLRPISFDWKSNGGHDFGLGAEDVEGVAPELVIYKDGQVEGVKYDRVGVVLINAIKEQQSQIQQQQQEIKRQQDLIKRHEEESRQQRATFALQAQQLNALKKLVCRSHRRAAACR